MILSEVISKLEHDIDIKKSRVEYLNDKVIHRQGMDRVYLSDYIDQAQQEVDNLVFFLNLLKSVE